MNQADLKTRQDILRKVCNDLFQRLRERNIYAPADQSWLAGTKPDQLDQQARAQMKSWHRGYCYTEPNNELSWIMGTSPLRIHFGTYDGREFRFVAGLLTMHLEELGLKCSWFVANRFFEIQQSHP